MINCNLVQYLLYTSVSKDKKGCAVIISEVKFTQSCLTLCDPHGLYSPWNSPGQKTGVGSLYLLQGIFPTQGSNPGLQHCRQILYQLSYKGNPRILECVAYPFFRGSSWPRNQTKVSCTAGGFFTSWATRKAQIIRTFLKKLNRKIYRLLIKCIRQ